MLGYKISKNFALEMRVCNTHGRKGRDKCKYFLNALRNASTWRVIRRRLKDNTAADLAELELIGIIWFKIGQSSRRL